MVYAGMILGRLPWLALDRTGIALLGAIALLATGAISLPAAGAAVDVPTLALLFGLMVVSAQLQLSGFYARVAAALGGAPLSPAALMAALVAVTGALSAVFTNDVVCLATAPVWIEACARRRLDPVPFLLALACASNVGSAATLIGNPQNILIGQAHGLSFVGHLARAGVPAALGLAATWAIVAWQQRGAWSARVAQEDAEIRPDDDVAPFDAWQTAKGLAVAAALLLVFVATDWPRDVAALGAAGALLLSRRLHSRDKLGLVDWPLLVLFLGLFVVHGAFAATGAAGDAVARLRAAGVDLAQPGWLFAATVALSNLVSNVPAVMLLLPLASEPLGATLLALASTLAGNLLLVGSIANLIVADAAARHGLAIDWRRHARTGVPVTLATLAIAALALLAQR
ncbi:MAG: anion transporter [Proteobacteria bacterium]|nr:MAG: anion transporter [Pseudomonadota bacterium]